MTLSTKNANREINQPNAHRVVWKYAQANFDRANELLSNNNVDEGDDTELAWSKWEKYFLDVMRQCIPTVTVKVNRNPPWLTHDLLAAIRSCNILYRRAHKTGKEAHLDCYRKKRNEVANINMLKSGCLSNWTLPIPRSFGNHKILEQPKEHHSCFKRCPWTSL